MNIDPSAEGAPAPAAKSKKKKKLPSARHDRAWVVKTLFFMFVACTGAGALLVAAVLWHFSHDLPKIITVADYRPPGVTRVLAAPDPANPKEEQLIGEFFKQERRYVVPYEKIPEVVVRAFISAEDDRFFEHGGVNIMSMIRASIANFRAGRYVQGGSTITQQVAKSLLLTRDKNIGRKIRELILANRIEHALTKQQILYLYLNQIYLGHGAYGVQAAARTYYRKDVSELSIAEAAVLGGLPQAPGLYSPIVNPKKAKERQLYVLRRMYENHFITQAQQTEAAAAPLKIYHDEDLNLKYAPYLVEHLRRYLVEKYGEKAVYEDGLTVTVPASIPLAKAAGKSLRDGLALIDKRIGYRGPLQHLESGDIENFLVDERIKLIERKLHYQMLMPDGRLDPFEAMRTAGLATDGELLEPGELYPGVITSFDERTCKASAEARPDPSHCSMGVMIGSIRAQLPIDRMRWAHPPKDEKNPNAKLEAPSIPSRVFKKGDVILVKLDENARYPKDNPIVTLEQEPQVQGALVSLEAQTGNVLAMEGGYDFEASEFNRATQALRQPGSSFKPIVYSAALEKGYTPASIIVDAPIVYKDNDTDVASWKPKNFEEKFYGDTTFRQALIKSRNIPSIKIAQSLTVPAILDYAKRLGIEGKLPNDLSISLGSASISLLEMTKAYALFPRLGRKVTPIFFNKVYDRDGKLLEEQKPAPMPAQVTIQPVPAPEPGAPPPQIIPGKQGIPMPAYPLANDPDQVLDPRVAYVMTHLMNEVVTYGTGHDAKALGRAAAGKTGTTEDYIDAWFMGFTPSVVTGVWVGFDNQKSIGPLETGARAALPIWLSFMQAAVKNYPDADFTIPPGVVFASIDPATGKLAAPDSSTAIKEAFIEGTQPGETDGGGSTGPAESQSEFFKEDTE
jgi:penicillin-binding protein 1A